MQARPPAILTIWRTVLQNRMVWSCVDVVHILEASTWVNGLPLLGREYQRYR